MVSARSLGLGCLVSIAAKSSAFQSSPVRSTSNPRVSSSSSCLFSEPADAEDYLSTNYPSASKFFMSTKGDALKKILKSEFGFTIFAPNEAAFSDLGETKSAQLGDVRNDEMTEKIAGYHFIDEPVTADQLFNSGGIVTLGGEVPAERSVSGGLFGLGGKEDGSVNLNGSKVVKSVEFGDDATKLGIIHEVDGFISPSILWRYADQLRIPGST